ncbi:MAG: hypothetical protein U1F10_11485 [Burkholderiales bacterium]
MVRSKFWRIFLLVVFLQCAAVAHANGNSACRASTFNSCALACGNDGQCIFGCMVGQDFNLPRCYTDCNGFAPACLDSCLWTVNHITAYCTGVSCVTPPGAAGPDGPVAASANFRIAGGRIDVTLTNDQADPKGIEQALNSVTFSLSDGRPFASLGIATANERDVLRGGTYLDLGPHRTGWSLQSNAANSDLELCIVCRTPPTRRAWHLLIGDPAPNGRYNAADASITDDPMHPFLSGPIKFPISSALPDGAFVTAATFRFGTQPGRGVQAVCTQSFQ